MGIGPSIAIPLALKQAGLTMDQIDLWEINEAFASQAVDCTEVLGIRNHPLLNPRGSGISLGHPLGCTGARLATTIMREMPYYGAKYAVESMCVGHGQGVGLYGSGLEVSETSSLCKKETMKEGLKECMDYAVRTHYSVIR